MRARHLLLVALLTPAIASAGDQLVVLDDGAQASIVYERGARGEAIQAYQDLAKYLQLSTGQQFAAVSETRAGRPGPGEVRINVGQTRETPFEDRRQLREIDRDAYIVHITPTAAYLVGGKPWSTYWAVCQFLEDYVGVRWLIPGEIGQDVPAHDAISVPCGRHLYEPVMLSRLWSGAHYGGPWSLRQRIHGRYRFHHNLLRVFDSAKYYDEHPEWYPQRGGKRYRPSKEDHSWQPCFASESSVKHAADVARAAFAADPDLESYSYGCNDGQGWCECEGCRATDRPAPAWEGFDGAYSYRYYTWLNKVAAELETTHPGNMLGCLAYSTYIIPPQDIGLHPNIIPYLTSNRADYYEQSFRRSDQALLEWWGRVANQMGIYDYAYGMGFAIPRIYSHLFQEAIQHAVNNSVKGFYAEVYPNWGLDGPKLYVMARVLWDPNVDIDAVTHEWNQRMFREAARPMARFFARCEQAWRDQDTGRGRWAYRLAADPKQFEVFPPRLLEECTGYLDEAAAIAQTDIVKERIHFFRKTWDVTLLLAGGYWAARDVQALVEQGATVERVAEALRRMADKLAATEIDAIMKEKVGDDPVAFHPPKPSWIAPLKAGAATNAKRWCAAKIAAEAVEAARVENALNAERIRQLVSGKIDSTFGAQGSEKYLKTVRQIRAMALKVATVVRAQTPPRIDGLLDDGVWGNADELEGFTKYGETGASDYVTRAWLAHDGANLYVALRCEQDTTQLKVEAAPRDGNTWHDDSVELFINPRMAEFPYIQFIINAKGAFFDQWGRDGGQTYPERLGANFECDWAAHIDTGYWTAEMRLPLGEFACSPSDHPMLRLDLVRNVQSPQSEISAWFPSVGAHADPLSRGWVVFE